MGFRLVSSSRECGVEVVDRSWPMNPALTESLARGLGSKRLKVDLPWDVEPLRSVIGDPPPISHVKAPEWVDLPSEDVAATVGKSTVVVMDRFSAKRHLSDISWAAAEEAKLNSTMQMWKVIVLDSTCNTKLGSTLMQCIQAGKDDDFIFQIVADVFSGKATSTLKSRASSLLAFGRWKRSVNFSRAQSLFPITEPLAYEYLCELRRTKSAASKRTRFLEAVGFSKGLLGADVDSVLQSARVRGAAFGTLFTAPRKKNPLTVQQLVFLERLAMDHNGPEGIFAGYVCFIVHCRLRWSDGQHCKDEPHVDITDGRGFVEAELYHHKTAKKRRTQTGRLLPVAGVLPGVSGELWAPAWLRNRSSLGLKASMESPTMPAPCANGSWSRLPLKSSEASVWLREILAPMSPSRLSDIATHSCKATILSWMSKANTPLSLRRLAGYHVKPGDKSALEYSRDAAAPILKQISGILLAIRSGQFCPDEDRSARWVGCENLEEAVQLAANAQFYWDDGHVHAAKSEEEDFPIDEWEAPQPMHDDAWSLDGSGFELVDDIQDELSYHAVQVKPVESGPGRGPKELDDSTTLEELMKASVPSNARTFNLYTEQIHSDSDDVSGWSSSTESDSASSSSEVDRRCEIEGAINASDLVAPSDLLGKKCYQHLKSLKYHFVGRVVDDVEFLSCGRRVTANYRLVDESPAFTLHGCLMCFGVRSDPDSAAAD